MVALLRPGPALFAATCAALGCGGPASTDVGEVIDGSEVADGDAESSPDADDADGTDAADASVEGRPDLYVGPACGNGLLEDGEECDDGNRVDGDECDWTCRTGPGEPARPPDPAAEPMTPVADPLPVEGVVVADLLPFDEGPIPLVWNGSSLTTLLREVPSDGATVRVRFHRFRADGTTVGPDWTYDAAGWSFDRLDLVWHGSGYGLFFTQRDVGVCYQRLEADGKPLGSPIVLVPGGRSADADRIPGGFIVSFGLNGRTVGTTIPMLALQRFTDDGTPIEPRLFLCEQYSKASNVAAGSSGFALMSHCWDPDLVDERTTTFGFFVISPDVDRLLGIEWLDNRTRGGTVGRTEDGFYAAWDRMGIFPRTFCVGRFGSDGTLLRSPGCTTLGPGWDGLLSVSAEGARADQDEHGLGMVFVGNDDNPALECTDHVMFLRTDADGHPVGEPINVLGPDAAGKFDGLNVAWAGDSYVVIAKVAECASSEVTGYPAGLYIRRFVPISP